MCFPKYTIDFVGQAQKLDSYSRPRDAMWKSIQHRTMHLRNDQVCS